MKCGTSLSCTSTSFASKVQAGAINVWKHLVRPGSVWQCVFKRFLITTPFSKDPFFSIHVETCCALAALSNQTLLDPRWYLGSTTSKNLCGVWHCICTMDKDKQELFLDRCLALECLVF